MTALSEAARRGRRLRSRLVEGPGSLGSRARARRWDLMLEMFPELASMSVLDLGGTTRFWLDSPIQPAAVTVVNLVHPPAPETEWVTEVIDDACNLGDPVGSTTFDLVCSNSLIEHVGGHARRQALAHQVHLRADRHWVQTPYRYFPVEPHWLFPGFQFLPVATRAVISQRWPLIHTPPADRASALRSVMSTELIGATELETYFPSSRIVRERFAGLTKSIVAVKM